MLRRLGERELCVFITNNLLNVIRIVFFYINDLCLLTINPYPFLSLQSLLRTAEQLKIKGLCEVSEPQYEQDYSPSVKRYKPYHSRSPDNRHPPPGSQPLSNTRNLQSSSSQSNINQSGQDSKSGHRSSSGRSHNSNSESATADNGSSPVVVLESRDLTSTPDKEGKAKMTSLGMGVGIVSKLSEVDDRIRL